jgi:hypothetical protein
MTGELRLSMSAASNSYNAATSQHWRRPLGTDSKKQKGAALVWWLVGLVAVAGLLLAVWIWIMMSWSYSSGERAGWVQKLSKKGWLCKTWEGEMAMVSLPGSMPEKFLFTVWDDATADKINNVIGRRVSLYYEEHIILPTTCFGETRHFVKAVKVIEAGPAPLDVPLDPGALGAPPQAAPAPAPAAPSPGEQKPQ